jgi:peroxiredoxin
VGSRQHSRSPEEGQDKNVPNVFFLISRKTNTSINIPITMAGQIQPGTAFPDVKVFVLENDKPKAVQTAEVFKGKKVVLFALPGAFTPTCSKDHCPSFVREAKAFKSKGVDIVACTSVNDAWVMDAWARDQKTEGHILMLADGNADLAKAVGLVKDASGAGLGIRSKRYALYIEDLTVKFIAVDETGYGQSSAENVLKFLEGNH